MAHSGIPLRTNRITVSNVIQIELTSLVPPREQTQGGKYFIFLNLHIITARFSYLEFLLSVLFYWLCCSKQRSHSLLTLPAIPFPTQKYSYFCLCRIAFNVSTEFFDKAGIHIFHKKALICSC